MKLKLKLVTTTFALFASLSVFSSVAQAYICCVKVTIPSCDFEVHPQIFNNCAENSYGVACEQEARQYCGAEVSCPNGDSGSGTTVTCGETKWPISVDWIN